MIFAEHRYFGQSYPYEPSEAFTPEHNIYLTVEQTMMDYVKLVGYIRETYGIEDKAAITFGGSYGGMLAAWLRIHYPNTFQGAMALSAPFLYFEGAPSAPEYAYEAICTEDFRKELEKSPDLIRESFEDLVSMADRPDTWEKVSEVFNTCSPVSSSDDIMNLYMHLSNGYQYMAMTDYPYPAAFLEPMPAFPVRHAVKPFIPIPTINQFQADLDLAEKTATDYWLEPKGAWEFIRDWFGEQIIGMIDFL